MKLVGFDVETRGVDTGYALQPFRARRRDAWLTTCAFAGEDIGSGGTVAPTVEYLRRFLTICAEKGITICGWNILFDMAWLISLGLRDEVFACKWLDGMLLWRHFTASPEWSRMAPASYGLKAAVKEFLPQFAGYEEDVDFDADTPEGIAKLLHYNKQDALFTVMLVRGFWDNHLNDAQRRNALIEAACFPLMAETYVEGIKGDGEAAAKLSQALDEQATVAQVKLAIACDGPVDVDVLASPTKLRKLLFEDWGLKPVKQTRKGADSTDRDALNQLAEEDSRASLLNEYRECKNNRTKFAEGMIKSLNYNGDGNVRPSIKPYGTYTGRCTYGSKILRGKDERPTGVALHQWKRGQDFRDMIVAPEGYSLLEWDFSGQEYRWMAYFSNDHTMLSMCEDGEDGHSYMGAMIAGLKYRDVQRLAETKGTPEAEFRQMGKLGNLSCLSGETHILTDRGWVYITDVTVNDLLWDGVEWVSHDGVVYMGDKEVIEYDGLTATPDHRVLVDGGWLRFDECIATGCRVDRTVASVAPPTRAAGKFCRQIADGQARPETRQCYATTLLQPERRIVQELWRTGYRVQVRVRGGRDSLGSGESSARGLQGRGHRQGGQQWALRAGEFTVGHTPQKLNQHADIACIVRGSSVGGDRPDPVLCPHNEAETKGRAVEGGHHSGCLESSERKTQGVAHHRGKVAVYDIINAGPRHRFTANGQIVSNCQYRTSAATLERVARVQYGLKLTTAQARAIHGTYRTTYPGVPMYWQRQIDQARTYGWAETVAGRRVHVGLEHTWQGVRDGMEFNNRWGSESTAINFPIQGSGADQKYLAIAMLRDFLKRYDGRLYFELHDGIYVIVPDRYAERVSEEGKKLLSNLPYKQAWGVTLPIQFPVDAKLGKTWGSMTKR